jgi:hypothetical protein
MSDTSRVGRVKRKFLLLCVESVEKRKVEEYDWRVNKYYKGLSIWWVVHQLAREVAGN